jgi:hypothetical protein
MPKSKRKNKSKLTLDTGGSKSARKISLSPYKVKAGSVDSFGGVNEEADDIVCIEYTARTIDQTKHNS